MTDDTASSRGIRGIDAVANFLDHVRAPYQVVEHRDTFAAADEAREAKIALDLTAKTVVLHDHDGFRLAVIPASERLDLRKARVLLGASGHLRLASEAEIEREFPVFDSGALPPFSALVGAPEILDRRLLEHEKVVCSGGDHRHTLIISPREIERLGKPLVADVCV
jgi:Ala-tRNA(Pro) deacylase